MPYGIIIIRWDDKLGVVVEGMYPKVLKISEDHIMRIFTTHAMGLGEASFLSISIEKLYIASYYTGLPEEGKSQYCIVLLLNDDENADIYEEPLIEITPLLIAHLKDKYFGNFLIKQYEDIQKLTNMTEEQRFAMIHRDSRRLLVLRKLGLGAIQKDELKKWLSDQIGEEILDLNAILAPFLKTQMIKDLPVETMNSSKVNCVFLIKDVFSMRSPVEKFYKIGKDSGITKEMKKIFEIYKDNVERYFKEYKIGDADSKKIAEIIADPSHYDLITILRNNYVEINQLPDIYKKSLDQLIPSINELKRVNIIDEIKDERGNRWIFLKTDVVFPTFFPEYIVDNIRRRWMEKNISQNLALKHLELLKSVYRGEEEEFVEKIGVPIRRPKEELPFKAEPTKKKAKVVEITKVISDEDLFILVERVNYLRKEAKMDLDKLDREAAYNKLKEAIKITKDLIAAGAVGQEKRLVKLEGVISSLKKLIDKEKAAKFKEERPSIPAITPTISTPKAEQSANQQNLLRKKQANIISMADKALTEGKFNESIEYLEKAAAISEKMGENDKANNIRKMADDIRKRLKKL